MTPARRRRRIIHGVTLAIVILVLCFFNSFLFLYHGLPWDQKLVSILMGRRPSGAEPGAILIRFAPLKGPPAGPVTDLAKPPGLCVDEKLRTQPVHISFEMLGKWKDVERKTTVPGLVRALDGKMVEITGLMLSANNASSLDRFVLVRSLWDCCFGRAPAPNQNIMVTMMPGRAIEFCPDPVSVTGVFSIGETREKGDLVSVYRLDAYNAIRR